MQFGLTNAPASFQNLVNEIFADFLDIFVVVYLDDIMVLFSSEEEHVKHVASVLQRLRDKNLFAKASKCVFHASSVEYLGYVVSSDGLKMDSSKAQQILNWPHPKNIKALQSFLGFSNFYLHFIKNYSKTITALTFLLKKGSPFIFNEEALSQFQILKGALTIAPILSNFNPSLTTIVGTDASNYALSAVLSQVNPLGDHPIAFDSRKHLPAELNHEIHDKELLGIVWALKHWRASPLSLSNYFEVLTDHFYLKKAGHFTRCLVTLGQHVPREGVDFISKNPQNFHQVIKQDGIQKSILSSIKVKILSDLVSKIQKEIWQDKDYKEILKQLARGESVTDYSLETQAKLLFVNYRVVIPSNEEIQLNSIQKCHDSPLAGHLGQEKIPKLIKRDFYWAGMNQFSKDYVSSVSIVSDRGSLFFSSFWTNLCQQLKISRDLSTAFDAETDGQAERVNQAIGQYLWMYVSCHQDNWHTWLPLAQFSYNNSEYSSTQQYPFFTIYGRNPIFHSIHISQGSPAGKSSTKLQSVKQVVKEELESAIRRFKRYTDRNRLIPPDFQPGDKVWLASKNIKTTRPTKKLSERWLVPFQVIKSSGSHEYHLKLPQQWKSVHPVFHVSLLEPVKQSSIPNSHQSLPPPVLVEEQEEWGVAQVWNSKLKRGK
ncbi:hypothetical protein O181_027192 [Austropuccinia psidii MF-1]|uniref:Reverse transcriptase domain-containing protein n=1 Tax=Austropuccinia psidii MF-1 TaxID=1389203 RepID=A0A9Q3CPI9_9BASI|nr:hypothetical protein [Austropuccinia psidii MF-1]